MDPQLGKLSMPQSMNRYVYCVNNPLRFTDPTGEWFGISLKDVSKWWHENWQTVAMVALCVAVTVATGGAGGGIAVGMLYGAIAGAGTNMLTYSVQTALAGGKVTLQGLAAAGVSGAITGAVGAVTGGIGSGAIKIGGVVGTKLAGTLGARLGVSAGIGALGGDLSYVAGEVTKMALTGGKEGKITFRGLLFSAAAGAGSGAITGYLKSIGYKPGIDDYRSMQTYGQAVWYSLPGAVFTATMNTLKSVAGSWAEEAKISSTSQKVALPGYGA
jgi:hypothetical protein